MRPSTRRTHAAPEPAEVRLPIKDIVIGQRHRRYLGDIEGLAESIATNGLLHPVVVTPTRDLIAGERRILAAEHLGWADIPVTIIDPPDLLRAEADENTQRLDFSPTEAVEIAKMLRPIEEAAAKERQREHAGTAPGKPNTPAKLAEVSEPQPSKKSDGESRKRVAAAVGMSATTLEKAEAVVAAAEKDPELGAVVAKMDSTGNVTAAYRAMKREQNKKAVAATPVVTDHVPGQKYPCIVIDPPWDFSDEGDANVMGRSQPTYATMPLADIEALSVGEDAEDDCHIYLWITNRSLPKGFGLLRAWGFRYITTLTWCKPGIGIGNYFRNNTEHVLFGVRGSLPLNEQDIGTWFRADRGPDGHSSKPEEFYDLVRRASPGPRAEWFGRRVRDGFVQRLPAVEL